MSSRTDRSNRRRKMSLELDLNVVPPVEVLPVEGGPSVPDVLIPMIHVDTSDDDIIETSPRSFQEATINARRNRRRINPVAENQTVAVAEDQRAATNNDIINWETSGDNILWIKPPSPEPLPPPPSPPPPPVFNCPICMAALEEEMTTRCGHIFCKKCIRTAIHKQAKCPTCRKKITMRELIRVFLPSAN